MNWTKETWPRDRWPNFQHLEMACSHCRENRMDEETMDALQLIRNICGPLRVTSGYRCEDHPVELQKSNPGAHTLGKAVDIAVAGSAAHALLVAAVDAGIEGIGVRQHGPHEGRFIHLDTITDADAGGRFPRPWVWGYST